MLKMSSVVFVNIDYNLNKYTLFMKSVKPQKPKLPTQISTLPRRPLLNLTNLPQPFFSPVAQDDPTIHQIPRSSSTKNARPRISVDQFCRPKLKEVHSRKNSRSGSIQSANGKQDDLCSDNGSKQLKGRDNKVCRNHPSRSAMHFIQTQTSQYLCLQCSLLYAKQGHKIKTISKPQSQMPNSPSYSSTSLPCAKPAIPNSVSIQSAVNGGLRRINRQKQTSRYLQKCAQISTSIQSWNNDQNTRIKQLYQKYGILINSLKHQLQSQITKLTAIYNKQISNLQQQRQQKIDLYTKIKLQVDKYELIIKNTRVDIQNNYQDCISGFMDSQFRTVMDQYWAKIKDTQEYISINSITNLMKLSQPMPDLKMTVRTMIGTVQRSNGSASDFTFSKQQHKFDTPPFSKQLRGIKIVDSYPDSLRYQSDLRESVVDSKININDFRI